MKKPCFLIGIGLLLLTTGCVNIRNGFSQFYRDSAGSSITNLQAYSGTTKIVNASSDPKKDIMEAYRNGYWLIGESTFQGPPQSENALMYEAKKVGADLVLNSCVYLGSQQVAVPFVQYQPGQMYTTTTSGTLNANTWGNGGYAYGTGNYYGTSTTTSPGTFSTQVVPVTVQRYQYDAGFLRRTKTSIAGVIPQPLPDEIRQKLQQNTGVIAWIVKNDSPAFEANILEGDVILKMNQDEVKSVADFSGKIIKLAGQKVDFEVWRNGEFKTITVQFNNKP